MVSCASHWQFRATAQEEACRDSRVKRENACGSAWATRWSSRISRTSGLWFLAETNKTNPLRGDTRTRLLRDSTHSGARWRNSWSAGGSSRSTIESRTSFALLRECENEVLTTGICGRCLSQACGRVWKHLGVWAFRPCEVVCSFPFSLLPPTMVLSSVGRRRP